MVLFFDFQVINWNFKTTYSGKQLFNMDASKQQFITDKLLSELKLGYITHVNSIPQSVHYVFCLDKASSYRMVVDCSKPLASSVNNYVNEVSSSFSYTGIDSLITNMSAGDYIAVTDIKNAYRSVRYIPLVTHCKALFGILVMV